MATSPDGKPKVRTISAKQRAHLARIASQGGRTVTPRKLESLRKARAAKDLRDKAA